MSIATLEIRVATLEKQVRELLANGGRGPRAKDWRRTRGAFTGDDLMRQVFEEGRKAARIAKKGGQAFNPKETASPSMILLDTDHLSVFMDERDARHGPLNTRMEAATERVARTIVSAEEMLRGWSAAIHRLREESKITRSPPLHLTSERLAMLRSCSVVRAACFVLLSLAATALCAEQYKFGPDSQRHEGVPRGVVAKHLWKSKIFAGTVREYYVYVPKQYDPAKPPP